MLAAGGVNFSIVAPAATSVELLLFEAANSPQPFQVIALDPDRNRTRLVWHVFVEGLAAGAYYSWRMDGPGDTASAPPIRPMPARGCAQWSAIRHSIGAASARSRATSKAR